MKNSNFQFNPICAMEYVSVMFTPKVTNSMTSIVYQHKISNNGWNHRVSSLQCFIASTNYAKYFHINLTT